MNVEVCANSFFSARVAQDLGASRVELCEDLRLDGLTPSYPLIEKVTSELNIPVHILIRPRAGDFNYTSSEINTIQHQIEQVKILPISGIVVGHLNSNGTLDPILLNEWRSQCEHLEITFHRAFDRISQPHKALDVLIEAKFNRILSSGQAANAVMGLDKLLEWQNYLAGKIDIMPGGGINHRNAHYFLDKGFLALHLSAKASNTDPEMEPIIDPETLKKVLKLVNDVE